MTSRTTKDYPMSIFALIDEKTRDGKRNDRYRTEATICVYTIVWGFIIFFILLVLLWSARYTSHQAFFGTKCIRSGLENQTGPGSITNLQMVANKIETSKIVDLKNPENITFGYALEGNTPESFIVSLIQGSCSAITSFPTSYGNSSGYLVNGGGVSIYLEYWTTSPGSDDWSSPYGPISVIEEGISAYIAENNLGKDIVLGEVGTISLDQTVGDFSYSVDYYSSGGNITVSTDADTESGSSHSFFANFLVSDNVIVNVISSGTEAKNPLNDYLHTKQFIKNNKDCQRGGTQTECRCTDPGAKDLPSCDNVYYPGHGYMYTKTDGGVSFSKNCTYSNKINTQRGKDATPQTYSQFLPYGTQISSRYNEASPSQRNSNTVTPKLSNQPLPGGGLNSAYNQAFSSNYIFCGQFNSSTTGPSPFPSFNINNSSGHYVASTDPTVGDDLKKSNVPNAQEGPNNTYVLGPINKLSKN